MRHNYTPYARTVYPVQSPNVVFYECGCALGGTVGRSNGRQPCPERGGFLQPGTRSLRFPFPCSVRNRINTAGGRDVESQNEYRASPVAIW